MTILAGSNGTSGSTNSNGSAARFNSPRGLVIGSDSTIYIADYSNYTVRALNPATSNVTLYIGTSGSSGFTSSNLAGPTALALYSSVLYISDRLNNAIVYPMQRASVLSTSTISTNSVRYIPIVILNNILYYGQIIDSAKLNTYNLITGVETDYAVLPYAIQGICIDSNSNVYCITNQIPPALYKIYKVTNGAVSLLFDDLLSPNGISVDPTGNYLFVSSSDYHSIMRITITTGNVVTIAGSNGTSGFQDGIGSAARFYAPNQMCIDTLGSNLFVSDTFNHRIRRVNIASSTVTTLAGNGTEGGSDGIGTFATLAYPLGIVYGNSGRIYFFDGSTGFPGRLRAININTLNVFTLDSPSSITKSRGIAVNSSETVVYQGIGSIKAHTLVGSRELVTLAGGTSGFSNANGTNARFNTPQGISFRESNLLVADTENSLIRQIDTSATVTTYAGRESNLTSLAITVVASSFSNPTAILYSSITGHVYVCSGNAVRKIANGNVTTLSTSFSNPTALCINTEGTILYITDTGNGQPGSGQIKQLVLANSNVTTVGPGLSDPQGICCDATNIYVANTANHVIYKYLISGSVFSATVFAGGEGVAGNVDGIGTNARFNSPRGLAIGSDSTIYVADFSNYSIRVINPGTSNVYRYNVGTGTQAFYFNSGFYLRGCSSIVLYSNRIYASDTPYNYIINEWLVQTNPPGIVTWTNTEGPIPNLTDEFPTGVAFLNNILYISTKNISPYGPKLITYNFVTGDQTNTLLPFFCQGVCVDSNSNAYCIVERDGIFKVTNGFASRVVFLSGTTGYASGICVDPTGVYLYLAESSNHCIKRISTVNGSISVFAGVEGVSGYVNGIGAAARFSIPSSICIDTLGCNLYVSDYGNSIVRQIEIATSNVSSINHSVSGAGGIAYGASGRIYVVGPSLLSIIDVSLIQIGITTLQQDGNLFQNNIGNGLAINPSETVLYSAYSNIILAPLTRIFRLFAGGGTTGESGFVNSNGSNARFNTPQGLSFQGSNLLVADRSNSRIRQINPSSNVTTYAGTSTNANIDGAISTTTFTTPQTLSLYSNSLYTMMNSNTTSSIVQIPLNYPPTTFTFSAPVQGQQIQNTTGRALTIAVSGSTVTNPTLNSIPGISDIKTLSGTGPYRLV